MRIVTILSAAALALSGAALAQVANSPSEQKIPDANASVPGNDMLMSDNSLSGPPETNAAPPTSSNATAQPPEGDPTQASSAPPRPR